MPKQLNLFRCLLCHRTGKHSDKSNCVKNSDGSVQDITHYRDKKLSKQLDHDGSVKETLSLSTTSQTPGCGDAGSASLGGWSAVHQNDSVDVSKVNFLVNEDCNSVISNALGSTTHAFREEFCDRLEALVMRLENVARRTNEKHSGNDTGLNKSDGLIAFESMMDTTLKSYINLSNELGGNIKAQALRVREAFVIVRNLIEASSIYCKPSLEEMTVHLKPLHFKFIEIENFVLDASSVRRYQLSAISVSSLMLLWVDSPNAEQFAKETKDSSQIYANKVVQYCKSCLPKHVEWIRSWLQCLDNMCTVIGDHFRFGLTWVPKGPKLPLPLTPPTPPIIRQADQVVRRRGKQKSLISSIPAVFNPPSNDTSSKREQLLSEIKQGKYQLRHVTVPDV